MASEKSISELASERVNWGYFKRLKKEHWYVVTLLLVVCASVWPLFAARFYAVGDMRDVFIPIESFYREQLLQGNRMRHGVSLLLQRLKLGFFIHRYFFCEFFQLKCTCLSYF